MPRQTPEQYAAFQQLCRDNHLDPRADVWQQKQSGQWIIGRTGIEKIQALGNIAVEFEVAGFGPDYAGVKAKATRSVKAKGARTAKKLVIESFGSAHPKNCQQITYYLEMAEKRAKSRAVLMLMGFYALGIYGEDEADDFQRNVDSISGAEVVTPAPALPAGNVGGGSPIPSEPPVTPAASSSAAPAASAGAGPNMLAAQAKEAMLLAIEQATSTIELRQLFEGIHPAEQERCKPLFTAAKARVAAAVAEAAATSVRQPPATVPAETGHLKEAGSDSALVYAFVSEPNMPSGTFAVATTEQKQEVQRLLNHAKITRKEKTAALLTLNKLDTERARQLLGKLRTAITEREGYHEPTEAEQVGEVRAALLLLLKQHAGKLEIADEAQLRAALGNAQASLEELQAALRAGQEAAWDAESDGTERELAEVETATN